MIKAIEPCPEARYASAAAMAEALEDLQLVVGDSTENAAAEGDSMRGSGVPRSRVTARAAARPQDRRVKLVVALLVIHAIADLMHRLGVRDDAAMSTTIVGSSPVAHDLSETDGAAECGASASCASDT